MVIIILILMLGYIYYFIPSYIFSTILNMFVTTSFYLKLRFYGLLIVILLLIIVYYYGFSVIILIIYNIILLLIYTVMYFFLFIEFSIKAITLVGTSVNNFYNYMFKPPDSVDVLNPISIMSDTGKLVLYNMNKCKNATAIEKLFAKYNKPRETTHKRSIISHIMKNENMPDIIKNNYLLKCLTKEPPPPPPRPPKNEKCPVKIID